MTERKERRTGLSLNDEDRSTDAETSTSQTSTTQTRDGDDSAGADVLAALGLIAHVDVGSRLGPYELTRKLGKGGMGEVFAARRGPGEREVALKYLGQASSTALHRFKREFRAIADIRHHNLVDLGELYMLADGRAFYTMELIQGRVFHKYVRAGLDEGQLPNVVRLRRAVRQLLDGLCYLHSLGFVHRDIKATNVLVSHEGRVVILDFGLISERESNKVSLSPSGALIGTPSYIAPEHAARQRAGKPADLYAVGVMLYQALSGAMPFQGSPARVLVDKQAMDAPCVSELVPDAPRELVELCRRLLDRNPDARPSAGEALALFDAESARVHSSASLRSSLNIASRDMLLAELHEHLHTVSEGQTVTLLVDEDPRAGRGALFDEFIARVRDAPASRRPALVLRGRCLEHESLAYKGIDATIDALALQLRNMTPVELAGLAPRHVEPLAQMFPVMRNLFVGGDHPLFGVDATEQRSLGRAALRDLLSRAGERYQLIVCVEDFHWSDLESAQILAELVRTSGEPRLLMIVSFDAQRQSPAMDLLRAELPHASGQLHELEIGPPTLDESRALARSLIGDALDELSPEDQAARVDAYVERSGGDPFYLGRLVAQSTTAEGESLEQLMTAQILGLSHDQSRLLALIAACETPCTVAFLGQVMGEADQIEARLAALLEQHLVEHIDAHRLQTAHPKIREFALAELSASELTTYHRRLATVLSKQASAPHDAVASHYLQARERALACEHFTLAAEQAGNAFAFQRAIDLYQRALACLPADVDADRRRLLEDALARQLLYGGRTLDAVEILRRLATDIEATQPERARLHQRRAAQLLIRAGHAEEGLALMAPALARFGETLPSSYLALRLTTTWRRLLLRLRLRREPALSDAELEGEAREHLDTLLMVWTGLANQEALLTSFVHARFLDLALDAGEPVRLSIGLGHEAVLRAAHGEEGASEIQLARARALAPNPRARAIIEYSANVAKSISHRWIEAAQTWPQLQRQLQDTPGLQSERTLVANRYAHTLVTVGELRTLVELYPDWLLDTREFKHEREDAMISALAAYALLLLGDPEPEARARLLERARASTESSYTYSTFYVDLGEVSWLGYEGRFDEAFARRQRAVDGTRHKRLGLFDLVEYNLIESHARTCVAALCRGSGELPPAKQLRARARAEARKLGRARRPMYMGQAAMIDAALASVDGNRQRALRAWARAAEHFERAGMKAHLAAANLRRAQLADAREAALALALAQPYLDEQGIEDTRPLLEILAPAKIP